MSLFNRIAPGATSDTKIAVHRFGAALRQWAGGQLTRQQVVDAFALTTAEQTELDALKASYDALGTGSATAAFTKAARLNFMEDVFLLVETGDYTEAKAKSALGF
jgi:hypothetical protein